MGIGRPHLLPRNNEVFYVLPLPLFSLYLFSGQKCRNLALSRWFRKCTISYLLTPSLSFGSFFPIHRHCTSFMFICTSTPFMHLSTFPCLWLRHIRNYTSTTYTFLDNTIYNFLWDPFTTKGIYDVHAFSVLASYIIYPIIVGMSSRCYPPKGLISNVESLIEMRRHLMSRSLSSGRSIVDPIVGLSKSVVAMVLVYELDIIINHQGRRPMGCMRN